MDEKFTDNSPNNSQDTEKLTFEEAIKRKRKLDQVFAINEADMSLDKLSTTNRRGFSS